MADLEVANAVAAAGDATVIRCSLAELVELTRRARLVIGGDSGPMHMAAALGRPVVTLFGPTDPGRNGPSFPGARFRVLRNPASRLERSRRAETETGLAAIGCDEVFAAGLELLDESPNSGERQHG
jgi:heptosyltransferase-1